jgi:hypothetical protein
MANTTLYIPIKLPAFRSTYTTYIAIIIIYSSCVNTNAKSIVHHNSSVCYGFPKYKPITLSINNCQYALPYIPGRQEDVPQNTGNRCQMYHISHVRQVTIWAYIMPGWNLRVCSKCSNHLAVPSDL